MVRPAVSGLVGSSSSSGSSFQGWPCRLVRWKCIEGELGGHQFLYWFEQIAIRGTGAMNRAVAATPLSSGSPIVVQPSETVQWARLLAPVPGVVLSENVNGEITFEWSQAQDLQEPEDSTPVAPIGYQLQLGTTAGASDTYDSGELASTVFEDTLTDELPDDNELVYVTLRTKYPEADGDPGAGVRWKENAYIYGGLECVLHLAVNTKELSTVEHSTGVQCNSIHEWGTSFPTGFYLRPVGGGDYPWKLPPSIPATVWGKCPNETVVWISRYVDEDGQNRYVFSEANTHGGECSYPPIMRPVDDNYAMFTDPVPSSTLTGTSKTFHWDAVDGALEYWIQLGSAYDAADILNVSTGTNTFKAVTGLPDDGSEIYCRIWTRLADQPCWFYNEMIITAHTT